LNFTGSLQLPHIRCAMGVVFTISVLSFSVNGMCVVPN
jgi:hypothetical protein